MSWGLSADLVRDNGRTQGAGRPVPSDVAVRARRYVERAVPDPEDCRVLLEMLGLLDA